VTLAQIVAALRRSRPHPLAEAVAEFGRAHPEASFVQVGSNDGERLDPLHEQIRHRRWRGVMVEPVPYVFERLRANYGANDRVVLENVAIADADGQRTLYCLPERPPGEGLPEWYDALGSFHREVIARHAHAIPDIEERIIAIEVPCVTFDTLCARNGITELDLVHVDTEGYDFEVIKLIDLERVRPKAVLYEHYHFDPATRRACGKHLADHGYEEIANGMDAFALRLDLLDPRHRRLRRTWRRLRETTAEWGWTSV